MSAQVIRTGRAFELTRTSGGQLRVASVIGDVTRARARLERAVLAHRAIDSPNVARYVTHDVDAEVPNASFDVDAVADGEQVVARLSSRGPLPFEAVAGFVEACASALASAHATPHPSDGAPCCLGAVGWGAFVFERSGRFALLGFGAPLGLDLDPPSPGVFVAPEVAAGRPASPGADVHAFALLNRSMLGLVALPVRLASALLSLPSASDLRIAAWIASANRRLFVGAPDRRPDAAEVLGILRRTWARLGVTPDLAAFSDLVAGSLATPVGTEIRVAPDASWFAVGDAPPRSLARRPALRGVLAALVAAAREDPSCAVGVAGLFAAGWPGERIRPESSAGRVYVALSTLRRFGLADVIERYKDGYRIAPGTRIR